MEQTTLNLNVNFAVTLLNGSAGDLLIFVRSATPDKMQETMCLGKQRVNYRSVLGLKGVHLK